jgi:hypothetical protein
MLQICAKVLFYAVLPVSGGKKGYWQKTDVPLYYSYQGHFGLSDFPRIAAGSQDPDFFSILFQSIGLLKAKV